MKMKWMLAVSLFFLLSGAGHAAGFGLPGGSKKPSPPPKEANPVSPPRQIRAMSREQALNISKMIDPRLNPEDLLGTWKRVFAVSVRDWKDDRFGYQDDQGLLNFDGSQATLTFTRTASDWLPEGENAEYRVSEQSIIGRGQDFTDRVKITDGTVDWIRGSYKVQLCDPSFPYHGGGNCTYDESDLFSRNMQEFGVWLNEFGIEFKGYFVSNIEFSVSYRLSCGLLSTDHSRMVCRMANAAVMGYVRVK